MLTKKRIEVGDVFTNNSGCVAVVIERKNYSEILVQFQDEFQHSVIVRGDVLKSGRFKNPYYKSVCGVGYVGVGKYRVSEGGRITKAYIHWSHALERCYNKEYQEKYPSYLGCTVCEEWHNFQVFAEWFYSQRYHQKRFHLDKDLLFKNNKVYSPETCTLIPERVNGFLIGLSKSKGEYPLGVSRKSKSNKFQTSINLDSGRKYLGAFDTPEEAFYVYKEAKEKYIKELANQYKDQIDPRAYNALMSWEVNIDD